MGFAQESAFLPNVIDDDVCPISLWDWAAQVNATSHNWSHNECTFIGLAKWRDNNN